MTNDTAEIGRRQALSDLYNRGARFVRCDGKSKKPIPRVRWLHGPPPTLQEVLFHPGHIGLVPWSLGLVAVDIDAWDNPDCLDPLINALGPLCVLKSPRGWHVYCETDRWWPSRPWKTLGCAGELRSRLYSVLYGDAAQQLVGALTWRNPSLAGDLDVLLPRPERKQKSSCRDGKGKEGAKPPSDSAVDLSRVLEPGRNEALFEARRWPAYRSVREWGPSRREAWMQAVFDQALAANNLFPDPLPRREVRDTAKSIGGWVWARRDHFCGPTKAEGARFTPEQRRRGGENKARRVRCDNRERDIRIVKRRRAGESWGQIAAAEGCSKGCARRVVERRWDGPQPIRQRPQLEAARA